MAIWVMVYYCFTHIKLFCSGWWTEDSPTLWICCRLTPRLVAHGVASFRRRRCVSSTCWVFVQRRYDWDGLWWNLGLKNKRWWPMATLSWRMGYGSQNQLRMRRTHLRHPFSFYGFIKSAVFFQAFVEQIFKTFQDDLPIARTGVSDIEISQILGNLRAWW
jgi:hypothetical protein